MAEFPAFPLYIDALHTDCDHLTHAEFGLYLRLLFQMWRSPAGDGTIPNDDKWLGRRLKMTEAAVSSDLRPLIREFCQVRGSRLTQKRLQRELIKCHEYRKRQSDRANKRWGNDIPPSRRNAAPAKHPIPISKNLLTTSEQDAEKQTEVSCAEPPNGKREEETKKAPTTTAEIVASPALLNSRMMREARH